MKKLNLLCTLVGVSTLASSCAVITSCSSTTEVKSISVEMNNPVKYIGSSFSAKDLIVKAQYSDGTEKELGYTSTNNYQDGYDVSGIKMGHEFSHLDIGTHEITVVYKTFVKQVKFQVTQIVTASLVGSSEIGLSQSEVILGKTFETNLIASKVGTITIDKINVDGSALTSEQYTFQNNKLTIDGQYVTGSIIIFASFTEQSESKPVGITAITAGTFTLELVGDLIELPDLSYSTDNGTTWKTYQSAEKIAMAAGSTLLLKGNNPNGWNKHATIGSVEVTNNYAKIKVDFDFNLSGNLASLLDNNEKVLNRIPTSGCFANLFKECTNLKSIDKDFFKGLTKLSPYCYSNMFFDCDGLTDISDLELPAEEAAQACYIKMFQGCSKITKGPKILPAIDVREKCYYCMFKDCELLENMPELPATYLNGGGCYQEMFSGCSALKEVYDLPAINSTGACYFHMFMDCTALETAPAIAMEIACNESCRAMFKGCTSLTTPAMMLSLKSLADGIVEWNAVFSNMYENCSSLKVDFDNASYGTKFMTMPPFEHPYGDHPWHDMFVGTSGATQNDPDAGSSVYFKIGE